MRSRAPALKTASHIVAHLLRPCRGSDADVSTYKLKRARRTLQCTRLSSEGGHWCISEDGCAAGRAASGRTHADALPRVSVELPMGSRTV